MDRTLLGQHTQRTGGHLRWATRDQSPRDTWDPRSCLGRLHGQSLSPPQERAKEGEHLTPASFSSPCLPLHSPYIGADDLKARRERIQHKDLVP